MIATYLAKCLALSISYYYCHVKQKQTILKRKNRGGNHILPDCNAYYKATLTKTVW